MPINPNIALGIQPVQMENPVNRMAQVLQIRGMQDQAAARRTAMERQNKLLEVMGGAYAKPEEREEALRRAGFVDQATALTKNRVDAAKVEADTEKNRIDAAHKRVDSWGSVMGYVRQNPTAENAVAAVQHLVTMGVMPQEKAQAAVASLQADPSPQNVARFAELGFRAALTAKEQLQTFQTNNTGGQTVTQAIDPVTGQARVASAIQNTQSPDNAASNARMAADAAAARAVQIRGQNLVDARSREQINSGKAPAGYRFKADGSLEAIPGGPAAAKSDNATEGERKAATLLQRLEGSQRQLQAVLSQNPAVAKPELLSSAVRGVKIPGAEPLANSLTSEQRQQVEAAQLDMLDAALTLGTGAAYTREQLEGYRKSYFPQIGDDEATVRDKQDRLNNVIQAARIAAGRAAPKGQPAPAPGGASGGWGIQKVN